MADRISRVNEWPWTISGRLIWQKKNNGRGGMLLRFQWSLALDLIDSLLFFFNYFAGPIGSRHRNRLRVGRASAAGRLRRLCRVSHFFFAIFKWFIDCFVFHRIRWRREPTETKQKKKRSPAAGGAVDYLATPQNMQICTPWGWGGGRMAAIGPSTESIFLKGEMWQRSVCPEQSFLERWTRTGTHANMQLCNYANAIFRCLRKKKRSLSPPPFFRPETRRPWNYPWYHP